MTDRIIISDLPAPVLDAFIAYRDDVTSENAEHLRLMAEEHDISWGTIAKLLRNTTDND